MSSSRTYFFLAVLLVLTSAPLLAQAPTTDPSPANPASAQDVEGTRSAVAAGVLEWLVPTAGYAYAGDWGRGLLPNAVRLGGFVLFITQYEVNVFFADDDECPSGCVLGLVMAAAGSIWAIAGSVAATQNHNDRLREAASQLVLLPGPYGGLTVGLRLGW